MKPNTVLELIYRHAEVTPDKLCAADRTKAVAYGEMMRRVRAVAGYLMERGVKKGDVVGLRAQQSVEFLACLFGIQWLGAIACPIERSASAARTKEVLAQISSRCMLDVQACGSEDVGTFMISDAYAFDGSGPEIAKAGMEDIAEIIYTTGTTGKSKGILISNRSDLAIAENIIDALSISENEVELITSPMSHSLGLRRMYAEMYKGGSVVLSENFLLYDNFWGLIKKYDVTAISFVPAVLNLILGIYKDELGKLDKQLNYIQLGAAPVHEDVKQHLIELLPTTRLYNIYGSTEAGCVTSLEFSRFTGRHNCIGRPLVNAELFFTDESRKRVLEAVDEKSAGYLAFRGDMNMSGYVGDPEMKAEILSSDGVIYTNDIGYRGEDGLIYLLGRAGEVINRGGYKINPVEVEEVAGKLESVKDCACVPMKDDKLGELPKLFIVCEDGFSLTDQQVKSYIRRYLEDYKVPAAIERIEEIPRTFNGKIIRRQLIERDTDES